MRGWLVILVLLLMVVSFFATIICMQYSFIVLAFANAFNVLFCIYTLNVIVTEEG